MPILLLCVPNFLFYAMICRGWVRLLRVNTYESMGQHRYVRLGRVIIMLREQGLRRNPLGSFLAQGAGRRHIVAGEGGGRELLLRGALRRVVRVVMEKIQLFITY